MFTKTFIPALLVALLAGCASTKAASTDPVRARVVAELEQARQNGTYPPSEADYVYPNWVKTANPAGVIMTDGHVADRATQSSAPVAARSATPARPAVAIMTDGHVDAEAAPASVKGGAAQ